MILSSFVTLTFFYKYLSIFNLSLCLAPEPERDLLTVLLIS